MEHSLEQINIIKKAAEYFTQDFNLELPQIIDVPFNELTVPAVKLELPPSFQLYIIGTALFPMSSPLVLVKWGDSETGELLNIDWSWTNELSTSKKIYMALSQFVKGSAPYKIAYGDSLTPLTENPNLAKNLTLRKFLIGLDYLNIKPINKPEERVEKSLVGALAKSTVLIVGCGSVGSYMASQLVRSGLKSIILVDHDKIEESNISRTIYDLADIGSYKVNALAKKLLYLNYNLDITVVPNTIQEIDNNLLEELIEKSTIIVAATDDPKAQMLINTCAFFSQKPTIFIGLYKGAKGGEVAICVPSLTPCLRCMVGLRRFADQNIDSVEQSLNYGTGRLDGEIALNSDIHYVSNAGIKICYSLIETLKADSSSNLGNFISKALSEEKNFLTLGMEPDYWFYPKIFESTSGQYAFQSVWLTAQSSPECPICGEEHSSRENPYKSVHKIPAQDNLRKQLGYD